MMSVVGLDHVQVALAERLSAGGFPVIWDGALADARRFCSEDPRGDRIELLA